MLSGPNARSLRTTPQLGRELIRRLFAVCVVVLSALAQEYDTVISRGWVVNPETKLDGVRDVGIQNGKIAALPKRRCRGAKELTHAFSASPSVLLICIKFGKVRQISAGGPSVMAGRQSGKWVVEHKENAIRCRASDGLSLLLRWSFMQIRIGTRVFVV